MVKNSILSVAIVFFLGASANAQKGSKSDIKFINDIEVGFAFPEDNLGIVKEKAAKSTVADAGTLRRGSISNVDLSIENASLLQFKYSLALDTEVEAINNLSLFQLIDEWMGTPYRLGGSTKKGIDCSAFMQIMYTGLFGITLPRTSREQYSATQPIAMYDLKEGDLLFFNTKGGSVSHVGFYLQNNKFVHAGSSTGVTISDLNDSYWSSRLLRAGRLVKEESEELIKP